MGAGNSFEVNLESWNQCPPKKLSNPRVTILKEISKEKIKLDEAEERKNNAILKASLEIFLERMRQCDKTFKLLYSRVYYTGSYYSKLRISNADEYDLNLVLKLPLKYENLEVEFESGIASYGTLRLKNANVVGAAHPDLLRMFFVDGYLIPEKIRFWFQGVVAKALQNFPPPTGYTLTSRAAGPARTMVLKKGNCTKIDIDLVPVMEYQMTKKIPGIDKRVHRLMIKHGQSCFLVPKPYDATHKSGNKLWRLHFPDVEDEIIHNFGCVKPVIRLLKLLRDKNDWKILASYYLKTVVMWLILENPSKDEWREDKMGDKLIVALYKLMEYVKACNIPYFFGSSHNLIAKMNRDQSLNISSKLKRIIQKIESDHLNLWIEFGVQPTFHV